MNDETITLNREELWQYILRLGWRDRNTLSHEDIHILEQIRRFFSANLHLIRYAVHIEELTLTPRGAGQPPLAQVNIMCDHRLYRLTSDANGRVPRFRP